MTERIISVSLNQSGLRFTCIKSTQYKNDNARDSPSALRPKGTNCQKLDCIGYPATERVRDDYCYYTYKQVNLFMDAAVWRYTEAGLVPQVSRT